MFLLEQLVISIFNSVVIGLDIVGFFWVIRVLTLRWPVRPFLAMDRVGRPGVDPLIAAIDRAIPCNWVNSGERRKRISIAVTLVVIWLCQLAIGHLSA